MHKLFISGCLPYCRNSWEAYRIRGGLGRSGDLNLLLFYQTLNSGKEQVTFISDVLLLSDIRYQDKLSFQFKKASSMTYSYNKGIRFRNPTVNYCSNLSSNWKKGSSMTCTFQLSDWNQVRRRWGRFHYELF